jgi:hypothetical protein
MRYGTARPVSLFTSGGGARVDVMRHPEEVFDFPSVFGNDVISRDARFRARQRGDVAGQTTASLACAVVEGVLRCVLRGNDSSAAKHSNATRRDLLGALLFCKSKQNKGRARAKECGATQRITVASDKPALAAETHGGRRPREPAPERKPPASNRDSQRALCAFEPRCELVEAAWLSKQQQRGHFFAQPTTASTAAASAAIAP